MTIVYFKTSNGFKSSNIDTWSVDMQKEEELLWSYTEQRGFLQKHFSQLFAVTNYRIMIYNYEIQKMTGLLMMYDLDDVVVTDSYRSYNSTRYGAYGSFVRGFGVTGGQSQGQSVTIGRIVFLSKGKPIIGINGITDPNGLKRLVLAVKKALYPKKELQRFLIGITDENTSIIRNVSICLRCGTKNVKAASFCSKCGGVLR